MTLAADMLDPLVVAALTAPDDATIAPRDALKAVMPGPVPGIHAVRLAFGSGRSLKRRAFLGARRRLDDVDGRDKPGHDD